MSDRKMLKWQAFDSVMNSKKAVNQINSRKNKISLPILSEEQLLLIEDNISKAFECKLVIKIIYYNNGFLCEFLDYILRIDIIKKRIIFQNHSYLNFNQIINAQI